MADENVGAFVDMGEYSGETVAVIPLVIEHPDRAMAEVLTTEVLAQIDDLLSRAPHVHRATGWEAMQAICFTHEVMHDLVDGPHEDVARNN